MYIYPYLDDFLHMPGFLQVKYAMARDVRMDDLTSMIDKLGNWASTTQVLLATLEVGRPHPHPCPINSVLPTRACFS